MHRFIAALFIGAIAIGACAEDDANDARSRDVAADRSDTTAAAVTPAAPDTAADPHAGHVMPADPATQRSAATPHADHVAPVSGDRRPPAEAHAGHAQQQRVAAAPEHREHVAPDPHAAHRPPTAAPVPRTPGVPGDTAHRHPAAPPQPGVPTDTVEHHAHVPADTTVAMEHVHDAPAMDMPHGMAALGLPMQREASGTAWLPDESPMYALHSLRGRNMLMLHGVLYLQYIAEGSDRGDRQFGSTNWFMGMVKRPMLGGFTTLRAMLSAEAVTVGRCGYPDLLATGETCRGEPLHDRQHPHDLFMELAGMYERELSSRAALQLYGGLAGEPALGPVAYPHRISAISNPMAPIGHHWQDATHISFGLLTAGLFGKTWKAEASLFNGREPDEERYNIDLDRLDSYSGRLWWLPNAHWALQASAGYLTEAEPGEHGGEREDVRRTTASVTWHRPIRQSSMVASTLVWGQNSAHGQKSNAWLLESNLDLGGRHIFFARAERAEKSGHDLAVEDEIPIPGVGDRLFTVNQLTGGYLHQLRPIGDLILSAGGRLSLSQLPRDLEPVYGTRSPLGLTVFLSLRARAQMMDAHAGMGH